MSTFLHSDKRAQELNLKRFKIREKAKFCICSICFISILYRLAALFWDSSLTSRSILMIKISLPLCAMMIVIIILESCLFKKKGQNVVVAGFYDLGYGGDDEFIDNGVKVYRFRRKLASSFFQPAESVRVRGTYRILNATRILQWDIKQSIKKYEVFLNTLIKKHQIDVVEMPDYNDYIRFCKEVVKFPKLPVPTIVKLHGSMTYINAERNISTPPNVLQMEKWILDNADAVVSVSRYTADKTAKYFNYQKEITVLYNGINIPPLTTHPENVDKVVVYSGSLLELKGVYQLMKAWNIVVKEIPDAKLYIFGKGPVHKLKALLSMEGEKRVFFKGHVDRDKLFNVLASAEAAIFPSYTECFALGPMEAMVNGAAVIYTLRASGRELIQDGVNGMLIDPDDVESIAERIIILLTNSELRDSLAAKGKQTIIDKFSIDKIVEDHIRFYENVINKAIYT